MFQRKSNQLLQTTEQDRRDLPSGKNVFHFRKCLSVTMKTPFAISENDSLTRNTTSYPEYFWAHSGSRIHSFRRFFSFPLSGHSITGKNIVSSHWNIPGTSENELKKQTITTGAIISTTARSNDISDFGPLLPVQQFFGTALLI